MSRFTRFNLAFKVAGRIASPAVDEGATVAAGQKIASLEKVYFEDSLRQARAQRDQAAANFAKMEAGNRPEEIAQSEANVLYREALLLNAQQAAGDRAAQIPTTFRTAPSTVPTPH
jgi:HlyD family secretion protein